MKRPAEPQPRPMRRPPIHSRRRTAKAVLMHTYPLLVHPVPQCRDEMLVIAAHLARRAANQLGTSTPEFSENAAAFLASRPWAIDDLAARIARAVAANRGSLIIAADLESQSAKRQPRRVRRS